MLITNSFRGSAY